MPLRQIPRQPDPRIHDPPHPHLLPHQPHLNGVSPIPTTPVPLPNSANPVVSPPSAVPPVPNGVPSSTSVIHKLATANEQTWLLIGRVAEQMGDLEHALSAYENALRHNPLSLSGLTQVAGIARIKENYPKAIEFFQRVLSLQEDNGEVWSALGHCYLMQDDLQKAYSAYQQALYLLPNPKEDPKLWYGIGILYDRYGSLDHAEEAFSSVLRMDKDFDKANEILFRLGIIYKQQGKYDDSLQCFERILRNPPSPLAYADIWFQIGHVYEQQKDYVRAKDAYERVVVDNPGHAKVLQQLGWLYHQDGSTFQNQDLAIQYLTKSLEADSSDAQSWYLLGRAYMAGQKYNKAYEAYQQAVYRDGRNPTFWCSIGVLYFQINQFRDALDAYSRAIRINPYISEVWFDLGSLYESCNNQISDAVDAYARASELDPTNQVISQRLQLLKNAQATGSQLPAAPGPQDVHPTAYASAVVPPPPGLTGPPLLLQSVPNRPGFRADSRSGDRNIALPPPSQVGATRSSPGPFRGGPPPPVVIDDSRHHPSHPGMGPMEVDRPPHHGRDYPTREGPTRGPAGHQSLLLHHPVPQQQPPPDEIRNGASHGSVHHPEPYFNRPPLRAPSRSVTPPPSSNRVRSPPPPFSSYSGSGRQPVGPGHPNPVTSQRSPRSYVPELVRTNDHEAGWDRRPPPGEHPRDWSRERRARHSGEYASQPPPQHQGPPHPSAFYPSRSPPPHRHSPPEHSPRSGHGPRTYWETPGGTSAHLAHGRVSPPPPTPTTTRRYDPRYDARENRDSGPPPRRDPSREIAIDQRNETQRYSMSPEGTRATAPRNMPLPLSVSGHPRRSESPRPTPVPEQKERRRRGARDKDSDTPPSTVAGHSQEQQQQPPKKERRRRTGNKRGKDEQARTGTPKPFSGDRGGSLTGPGSFKLPYGHGKGSPEPSSSNGSSRSMQPSPTNVTPRAPSRTVDEDYDEGLEDKLMGLAREASHRAPEMASGSNADVSPTRSPTIPSGSRHMNQSPPHRESVSSTRSHVSSSSNAGSLKRALSQGPDDLVETKRTRMDGLKRRGVSPPSMAVAATGRRSPLPSTRPSPIPFRTQPASHSPESRQVVDTYRPNSPIPAVFPPHPRPIGAGLSSHVGNPNNSSNSSSSNNSSHNGGGGSASVAIALPPIATLSPTLTAPSPTSGDREERTQSGASRSSSPPTSRAKLSEIVRPGGPGSGSGSRSPPVPKSPASSMRDKMDTS